MFDFGKLEGVMGRVDEMREARIARLGKHKALIVGQLAAALVLTKLAVPPAEVFTHPNGRRTIEMLLEKGAVETVGLAAMAWEPRFHDLVGEDQSRVVDEMMKEVEVASKSVLEALTTGVKLMKGDLQ